MHEPTDHGHPQVTVVVPTCNRPNMLLAALQSVARQTYTDFECVVVNDHLPTQSAVTEAVATLSDSRFRLLHNDTTSGSAVTRNRGIRQARGSLLAFIDDDDTWMPEYLTEHVKAHEANVALVYSGVLIRWQDQAMPEKWRPAPPPPPPEKVPVRMLRGTFEVFTTSVISIKKRALEEVGYFDESLPSYEDWELCYRVGQQFPLGYVKKPMTVFFQHLKGRMTRDLEQRKAGLEALERTFSDDVRFRHFRRKHIAQMYFTSIRNNVLAGRSDWNYTLFKHYLLSKSRPWSSLYQAKVTVKMTLLLMLGRRGLRIINLF